MFGLHTNNGVRPAVWLSALIAGLTLVSAWGQGRPAPPEERSRRIERGLEGLQKTADEVRKIGPWDRQAEWINRAMVNVWRDNGWDDEPDQFALSVFQDVADIPPWQFMDRFDRFTERLAERYDLTDEQANALNGMMVRETGRMFLKYAPLIAKQVHEQVNLNIEAPDEDAYLKVFQSKLATWIRETESLNTDVLEALSRTTAQFEQTLTPEQRRAFDRDRATLDKLTRYANQQRRKWANGQWQPEDWGIPRERFNEQVRQFLARRRNKGAMSDPKNADAPKEAPPMRWFAHDPTTWPVFVRQFVDRYELDAAQTKTAESILKELTERAGAYIAAHDKDLAKVEPPKRATDESYRPIVAMFESLRTRLDAIPTQTQKDTAAADGRVDRSKGAVRTDGMPNKTGGPPPKKGSKQADEPTRTDEPRGTGTGGTGRTGGRDRKTGGGPARPTGG